MRFPPRFLDDLKGRVSIYDYAGGKIAWDRRKSRASAGDYWAPCPFHPEKSASFHVLDRQGIFKCFGCGAAGDVFGLCMKLEGVSFPEAVEQIAGLAGVPMPEAEGGPSKAEVDARTRLLDAMQKAASFFQARLRSGMGAAARAYLLKRGLPESVWTAFGLGFAPEGWSTSFDALTAAGLKADDLFTAGLAKQGQRGPIDVFRNRIMFPISDAQGKIIAFGGRAMDPSDKAKYLNSPETPLFHKGRTLYRLADARRLMAKTKAAGLVVAEGYLDAIAFERAGVAAVAPLGTALTEEQLQLVWRSGSEPVLCFDGDGAGQRAASKALDLALPHLSPDRTLRFAVLTGGKDPDDIFQTQGGEAVAALPLSAITADAFLLEREVQAQPLTTPEARAGLKRRLRAACAKITDPDTRTGYLKTVLARADQTIRAAESPPSPPAADQLRSSGAPPSSGGSRKDRRPGRFAPPLQATRELKTIAGHARRSALEDALILAADKPRLLDRGADQLAMLPIADPDLSAIRDALLDLWSAGTEVDRSALSRHLLVRQDERAQARVLLWPPPVAPRRPRLREHGALDSGDAASPTPTPAPTPDSPGIGAIEAEWMALLEQVQAQLTLAEDLESARAEALSSDDPSAFARYQALLAAQRAGQAPAAERAAARTDSDPSQDAA